MVDKLESKTVQRKVLSRLREATLINPRHMENLSVQYMGN